MKLIHVLLIFLALGVVCINYDDDNPYDPDFDGDYKLDISWDALPDTLGAFIAYDVPFTVSGGDDTLKNLACTDTIIDSVFFNQSASMHMAIYFVNKYTGTVAVTGQALNGKKVVSVDTVVVITPFVIDSLMPPVFGDTFACRLGVLASFDSLFVRDTADSVRWIVNKKDSIMQRVTDTLTYRVMDSTVTSVKAQFVNSHRYRSGIIERPFFVRKVRPTVSAPQVDTQRVKTVYIPIDFGDSNDVVDSLFYSFKTINEKRSVKWHDHDTLVISSGDTSLHSEPVYIRVKDRSGLYSDTAITLLTTFIPDNDAPVIRFYNMTNDTVITPVSSLDCSVLTWDKFGVTDVFFTIKGLEYSAELSGSVGDSLVWKTTVDSLPFRDTVAAIATAVDSFNNRSQDTIYVYYDSTLTDLVPPVITLLSPSTDSFRDADSTGQIQFKVVDTTGTLDTVDNGIDSVYYKVNGLYAGPAIRDSTAYYRIQYYLPRYGLDTITIFARDSSAGLNDTSKNVYIDYNTKLQPFALISPANGATNIENLGSGVSFKWHEAQDADGDEVTYNLYFKLSTAGSYTLYNLSDTTSTLVSLQGGRSYNWYVGAMTELDTVWSSDTFSLTTKNHAANIVSLAASDSNVTINDTIIFTITATDPEGVKSYAWDFNSDGTDDASSFQTSIKYLFASAGVSDVVVSVVDSLDSKTKDTITVSITNGKPYVDAYTTGNGDTMYVGYNDSVYLNPAATDDGLLVKYEWSFDGGAVFKTVSAAADTAFSADTANLPRIFSYVFRATDEDDNSSMDTVFVKVNMKWTRISNDSWIQGRTFFPVIADENEIYVLGGKSTSGPIKRDVWRSTTAEQWVKVSEDSSFTARYKHCAAIRKDTLYVMGGDLTHDEWFSVDGGTSWDSLSDLGDVDALYQNKLAGAELVVRRDTLYLIGGHDGGSPKNKVYATVNGVSWNYLNQYENVSGLRFPAADTISTCVYHDSLWILSGKQLWFSLPDPFADIWMIDSSISEFSGCTGISIYQNIMFAVAVNSFWYSRDRGKSWVQMTAAGPWSGSSYIRLIVFNNKLWVFSDKGIWYSSDTP